MKTISKQIEDYGGDAELGVVEVIWILKEIKEGSLEGLTCLM